MQMRVRERLLLTELSEILENYVSQKYRGGMDQTSTLRDYADEIGLFFEDNGLPRMSGRVLGWLLVCEPTHQSADELADALQTSRSSISMAMQLLQTSGAVERYAVPGSRRTYYRLKPGFWLREAEEKAAIAGTWRKLADRGLGMLTDRSMESRQRLQEMRDMYAFFEEEYARMRDAWYERQESQQ
jgi:DNA-binding transcriptional regulator GbsR (MarR family)